MEIKTYVDYEKARELDNRVIGAIAEGKSAMKDLQEARSSLNFAALSVIFYEDSIYKYVDEASEQVSQMERMLRNQIAQWVRQSNEIEDAMRAFEEAEKDGASA